MTGTRTLVRLGRLALAVALASRLDAGTLYEIIPLDTGDATESVATDVNGAGRVVGYTREDGDPQDAFVFDGATLDWLPALAPGNRTAALAISDAGVIVGYDTEADTGRRTAVLWSEGEVVDIGEDLGAFESVARDVNDAGHVVGQASTGGPFADGFIWRGPGDWEYTGTLDGRTGGTNRAINAEGVVVGHSFFFGEPDQAHRVRRTEGEYHSEAMGAPFPGISVAAAINDIGIIVGHANTSFGPHTAAIFTPTNPRAPFIDLGTLPGATSSEAFDVNELVMIVGAAGGHPGWETSHAFVVIGGSMLDLNEVTRDPDDAWGVLLQAEAINDAGEIAGAGLSATGKVRAFLLVPTAFLRGDCDQSGTIDLSDAVCILAWLFLGADEPGCVAATNTDAFGGVDVSDAIFLLEYFFLGGTAPSVPFPSCGPPRAPVDATLGCATATAACP